MTEKVFSCIGASNHSNAIRAAEDYYSTDPSAIDYLLKYETFDKNIWECACGNGNLSERLKEHGYNVRSTDIIYRGYGERERIDFLEQTEVFNGDIITNPPYVKGGEFVLKALELAKNKVAMFFKIQFVEGQRRYEELYMNNPPSKIMPFVKRINCYRNNDQTNYSSAVCYAWYVWDKSYEGDTIIQWIDNR